VDGRPGWVCAFPFVGCEDGRELGDRKRLSVVVRGKKDNLQERKLILGKGETGVFWSHKVLCDES